MTHDISASRSTVSVRATDIALIATFAALIVVCAVVPAISVGGLVPITLQTFAVLLTGAVLGAARGFFAVMLYLGIGAIGFPVFAAGGAGLAPFVGPSAGYLIAMPFAAALTGFLVRRLPRRTLLSSLASVAVSALVSTLFVIHLLGILGLAFIADMGVTAAFIFNLSFMPGDLIKVALVASVATAVHRAFPDLLPRLPRRK